MENILFCLANTNRRRNDPIQLAFCWRPVWVITKYRDDLEILAVKTWIRKIGMGNAGKTELTASPSETLSECVFCVWMCFESFIYIVVKKRTISKERRSDRISWTMYVPNERVRENTDSKNNRITDEQLSKILMKPQPPERTKRKRPKRKGASSIQQLCLKEM